MKVEEAYMRVSPEFMELVRDFAQRFAEKHGLNKPSDLEVTNIIAKKIKSVGGLRV